MGRIISFTLYMYHKKNNCTKYDWCNY